MGEDAQQVAERAGAAMYARDRAAQALGIRLIEIGPGRARMTMTVRDDMLNGHDMVHGGLVFTLADTAFAYACNAYDQITVAAGADINFAAAGRLGEVLIAEARERQRGKRAGVYDIDVTEEKTGRLLATFRGRSFALGGSVSGAAAS